MALPPRPPPPPPPNVAALEGTTRMALVRPASAGGEATAIAPVAEPLPLPLPANDAPEGAGPASPPIVAEGARKDVVRGVVRKKLAKMRHLVLPAAISPSYLDGLFSESILPMFRPQTVTYNGGIAKITEWKISCYLEVMDGGVPCTDPNLELRSECLPLLGACDDLFRLWYRQQHACNGRGSAGGGGKENAVPVGSGRAGKSEGGTGTGTGTGSSSSEGGDLRVKRLMTFVTRYTAAPGEQALLKHVDGAGKVDGSIVVALPIDRWSAPGDGNSFEGHGGGLTVWDGRSAGEPRGRPQEIRYDTRSGDVAFLDRAVWHQANPITRGTRWALVIFYKVL